MTGAATYDDAIDVLERAVEAGENVWDTAVNLGMVLAQDSDALRYHLGDLACIVPKQYGKDTLGRFAADIGIERTRLQEYRTTCAFWTRGVRRDLLQRLPSVNYSLLRLTATHFTSPKEAVTFLEDAADGNWTVEKARLELKARKGETLPPEKVADVQVCVTALDPQNGTMTLACTGGVFPPLAIGRAYRLTLHELSSESMEAEQW